MGTLLDAALQLHAAGICVIPARTDGTKAPAAVWKRYQSQRPDVEQLRAWFTGGAYDGLGVICGNVSGGLEMLELEGRAIAENYLARLAQLLDDHGLGELWQTLTVGYLEGTPSGGLHLLYQVDGEPRGNTKLASRPARDDELTDEERAVLERKPGKIFARVLIETRGEGGFVVTAPSAGRTHDTGRAWTLLTGGPSSIPTITEEQRDALHAVASLLDEMPTPDLFAGPDKKAGQRASEPDGDVLRPGDDYNQRADWADILTPHGWRHTRTLGQTRGWARPGKTGHHISATTGRNDHDRLYVFSSSTEFETEKPYSKFAAYCVVPETKILRADLTWASAGDLVAGDGLVGVDEEIEQRCGRRKLRLTHVESVERRVLPCYRISLADGRTVTASVEHPWLAASAGLGGNMRWIKTVDLQPGQRICSLTPGTWESATDFDSGWLSGMYDGEGWASGGVVGLAQKPGPTLNRVVHLLRDRGFEPAHRTRDHCDNLTIASLPETLRLLGTLQPKRLVAKMQWIGRGAWTQAAPNALVLSVEYVGELETAAFMTTTRTFIAEGLVTHNTLLEHGGDHGAAARALRAAGYGGELPPRPAGDDSIDELLADPTPVQHGIDGNLATVHYLRPEDETEHGTGPRHNRAHALKYTDDWLALVLVSQFGDRIRYVPRFGYWLIWDDTRWVEAADDGPVRELLRTIARSMPADTTQEARAKNRAASRAGIGAAVTLAAGDTRVRVEPEQLDAHPWQLNTPAGIIDLRTGEIGPHDPTQLHTRITAAAPDFDADTSVWDRFLATTFNDDNELIAFMQRLVGYSAVGVVREHIFPFCYGEGGNGKGAFLEAVTKVLGSYAGKTKRGFLAARDRDAHPEEIASLVGLRMVITAETNETDRFDEGKVKELTGGDTLTGRFLYGKSFSFDPAFTLWLMGNHRPKVESGGRSFWRRMREIPFVHKMPDSEVIPDFQGILARDHGAALMAWIIRGAVAYSEMGLAEPEIVVQATREYESEQDTVKRFVEECCRVGGGSQVQIATEKFRTAYERWCRTEGCTPLDARALGRRLKTDHGVDRKRGNGPYFYTNVTLLVAEDEERRDWQ